MPSDPPEHVINPADLDEDETPTGAWLLGERLDADVIEALKRIQ